MSSSPDITGILRVNSPFVTVTDSQTFFTSLSPDEIKIDTNAFSFTVSPSCTNGYRIPLDLYFRSGGNTSNFTLYLTVGTQNLKVLSDSFSDESPYGNNNNFWEPGEKVLYFIRILNSGYAPSYNVSLRIKSLNNKLYVIDGYALYGDIGPNSSIINSSDPLILKADTSLNIGEIVSCSLFIYSQIDTVKLVYDVQVGYPPGTIIGEFQVPPPMQEGGWITGLAFDGQYLWVADYYSRYIYKLDPDNGSFVSYIYNFNFSYVYDLEYDNSDGTLWVLSQGNSKIYKVNPNNGNIIFSFNSPSGSSTGLGFDENYLWITGYSNNIIYKYNESGNFIGSYSLPYSGEGSRGICFDIFGRNSGTLIHTKLSSDYNSTIIYEWDRLTHNELNNFTITKSLRGIEFDPRTGDYWVSEPHSSVRGYVYKVVGFNHRPVDIKENQFSSHNNYLRLVNSVFKNETEILINNPYRVNAEISIFDVSGRKVKNIFKGIMERGENKFRLGKELKEGIHFVILKRDNKKRVFKIIKLK